MVTRGSVKARASSNGRAAGLDAWVGKLQIDKEDLDTCLAEQPDLSYYVGEAYADAVDRRDALKLDLEELQADLDKKVRAEAEAAGIKTTETQVKNEVLLRQSCKDMRDRK